MAPKVSIVLSFGTLTAKLMHFSLLDSNFAIAYKLGQYENCLKAQRRSELSVKQKFELCLAVHYRNMGDK